MKYITPKFEITVIETTDILAASSEFYEVEDNNDGSGNIIFNVSNLFS